MQWQAVESSQIEAIGYESGAEYPLGIKFPAGKRTQASEYHYNNVTPELHAEFLAAESIGSFFGKNIKSRPDLFPFKKVEADPTQPLSSPNGGGSATTRTTTTTTTERTEDAPSPGTVLALIEGLKPEEIFVPGNVDAILVKLREQALAMAKGLDPSTPAKQKRIRDVKGLVASQRIFVEKARKGYVADLVAKKGLTDKVSKAIQGRLSDIESEILEVTGYAAWEQEEKEFESRMNGLQNRLSNMGKEMHLYTSCAAIEAAIKEMEGFDTSDTREHKQCVERIIDDSLRVLKPELARRQEAERNAAELAELRRKQAEREESDWQAEAKRQEQQRIDAAVQEKLDAAIEAAKVETRQELIAELQHEPGEPEDGDNKFPTCQPFVYHEYREPVDDMRCAANKEAIDALAVHLSMQWDLANRAISAIAAGLIPHVRIEYE
jgi:hypothetical protein